LSDLGLIFSGATGFWIQVMGIPSSLIIFHENDLMEHWRQGYGWEYRPVFYLGKRSCGNELGDLDKRNIHDGFHDGFHDVFIKQSE
jgi:hypothetical protein